jgi:hypothetical protein
VWKFIIFVMVLWLVRFPAMLMPAASLEQEKGTSMMGLFCRSCALVMGLDKLQAVG